MYEKPENTKRFLVIYCIAICACAIGLILIASFSQARITREADAIREKLVSAEALATESSTRLDAVMVENSRLTGRITELETENAELKKFKEEFEIKLTAEQKLTELLNLLRAKKYTSYRTALKSFKEAGYAEQLSEESSKIFNNITK